MKRDNRSRYLDYGARLRSAGELERLKRTPTAKQVRYHGWLCSVCRKAQEDGLPIDIPQDSANPHTRVEYADAIDDLRQRLIAQGIDPHGNGKSAAFALYPPSDDMPRARERIIGFDEEEKLNDKF